jgi:hypothetical protein
MRILRLIALLFLLAAAGVGAADWVRHQDSGGPLFRSALDWWMDVSPGTLDGLQGFIEGALPADVWDPLIVTVLGWPAVLVLVAISFAIYLFLQFLRSFFASHSDYRIDGAWRLRRPPGPFGAVAWRDHPQRHSQGARPCA